MKRDIETIRAELKEAEKQEAANKKAALTSTPLVWKYTIKPVKPGENRFDKIYDDTCVLYRLAGTVVNREEAVAAGHTISEGGMNYLFNTLSGKIVMSLGGGHVYLGHNPSQGSMDVISAFLVRQPKGGSVTDMVRGIRLADKI